MITNIIFARNTWCSEYTNNLGLEIDHDKYKYLTVWGGKKEIEINDKISLTSLLYGSEEIKLTIEYFSL
jgi:hypothetical protein